MINRNSYIISRKAKPQTYLAWLNTIDNLPTPFIIKPQTRSAYCPSNYTLASAFVSNNLLMNDRSFVRGADIVLSLYSFVCLRKWVCVCWCQTKCASLLDHTLCLSERSDRSPWWYVLQYVYGFEASPNWPTTRGLSLDSDGWPNTNNHNMARRFGPGWVWGLYGSKEDFNGWAYRLVCLGKSVRLKVYCHCRFTTMGIIVFAIRKGVL